MDHPAVASPPTAPIAARQPSAETWTRVVCLARVFSFGAFMTVSATIPLLRTAFDASAAEVGTLASAFVIVYALSMFAFGWAGDFIGAKRAAIIGGAATAVMAGLFALFARDYWSTLLLYPLIGLFQGGIYSPLVALFSEHAAPGRRGAAMGWLIGSTQVGYALSLAASGVGIALGGWQGAFLVTGLLPAVGAVILVLALRGVQNRVHPAARSTNVLGDLVGNRSSVLLAVGYTAHSWELQGSWAWVPGLLATSIALSGVAASNAAGQSALLVAGMHMVGAVAAFSMGRLSDRLGRRFVLLSLALFGGVLSLAMGWLAASPPLVVGILATIYTFATIGDSPVLTTALSEAVPPARFGSIVAVRSLFGFGAGALAPVAVGAAMDLAVHVGLPPAIEWGLGFTLLGIGGLIAAWTASQLPRRITRPGE